MLYENRKKMLMNIEKRIFNIFEGKLKNKQSLPFKTHCPSKLNFGPEI